MDLPVSPTYTLLHSQGIQCIPTTFRPKTSEKSTVAEQRFETGHNVDFSSISILDKATGYKDHVIKEAIEIKLYPNNFNRDGGFTLSWSWYLLMNVLK
jgi:hypothetical protein